LISASTGGLRYDSIVLCYQIRTLDKSRLVKSLGKIEDLDIKESIIEALSFQLSISK